jgi:hypothetical protein
LERLSWTPNSRPKTDDSSLQPHAKGAPQNKSSEFLIRIHFPHPEDLTPPIALVFLVHRYVVGSLAG